MIAIYEPLYRPGQTLSEAAFTPLRLSDNDFADWREFRILIDMYRSGLHRKQRFTGLFSPKFGLKTKISGALFIDFVTANGDADVCFVNPFPHLAYISYNVWMEGEASHPGLTARAQALLDAAGVDIRLAELPRHGPDVLCYCNFWVGTEKFWDDYVGGVLLPIADYLEREPRSETARRVLDTTLHIPPSPFLPFIVERLFSSYLSHQSPRPRARAYQLDALGSCLNEFEVRLIERLGAKIDDADRGGIFHEDLKAEMFNVCLTWRNYTIKRYRDQPHPHAGDILVDTGTS